MQLLHLALINDLPVTSSSTSRQSVIADGLIRWLGLIARQGDVFRRTWRRNTRGLAGASNAVSASFMVCQPIPIAISGLVLISTTAVGFMSMKLAEWPRSMREIVTRMQGCRCLAGAARSERPVDPKLLRVAS